LAFNVALARFARGCTYTALIQKNGWTRLEAAKHCSVTQPRINELLRSRISRFSLNALVNISAHLGQRVHVELEAA